jgi:hypothetical protein
MEPALLIAAFCPCMSTPTKTAAMTFRFTARFQQTLRDAAEHERRSQANLIEVAVLEFCKSHGIPSKRANLQQPPRARRKSAR